MLGDLLAHAQRPGPHVVLAGIGAVGRSRHELLGGRPVDLATALLRRDAVKDVGGFDESLGGAVERDLLLRLTRTSEPVAVDVPVLRGPSRSRSATATTGARWCSSASWWTGRRPPPATTSEDLVSHVMPVGPEPRRTVEWLGSVPREGAELILVGVRLRRAHHVLAASIASVISGARFVSVPAAVSMSAATNVGLAQATGSTVVLVRPEAMPPRQPIAQRLAERAPRGGRRGGPAPGRRPRRGGAERRREVRRGQPPPRALPRGPAVQRRRTHRAERRRRPGRPGGGAAHRGRRRAARARPALPLRARRDRPRPACPARPGSATAVVVPDTVITSRTPYAGAEELIGAMSSLRRPRRRRPHRPTTRPSCCCAPGSRSPTSATAGSRPTPRTATRPSVLVPQLVVRAVDGIHESPPRLRWAIDIAAPAAPRGDRWGDTYFARSLADALERRGQHVAIDRRDARERDSRDHDDVLLVLRGLDRVTPRPGLLNVEWIISHPDMIDPDEVAAFDLVYAASTSWSERMTREWGTRIEPLLQCTDTRWFHPDRAEPDTGPRCCSSATRAGSTATPSAARSRSAPTSPSTATTGPSSSTASRSPPAAWPTSEVGALYASAGVVLNDHHLDMRRDSFASNRLFDAAACGARILSDRIDGLEETFSGLVLPFDNEHELARLVQPPYAAFPDDEARRRIAHPDHRRAQLRQARRDAHRRRRRRAARPPLTGHFVPHTSPDRALRAAWGLRPGTSLRARRGLAARSARSASSGARKCPVGAVQREEVPGQPRRASTKAAASKGAMSSAPSPRPTSLTGTPSSRWTCTTMPPLAEPSSLVSTMPVTSTISLKTRAWIRPF